MCIISLRYIIDIFFFNVPATTFIYTLSLHDALPIYPLRANQSHHLLDLLFDRWRDVGEKQVRFVKEEDQFRFFTDIAPADRKSTRLNSSHVAISYAVFCLKKKKKIRSKILPHAIQGR